MRTFLDEVPEESLRAELKLREKRRKEGLCDYCGMPLKHPPCKFPERHTAKKQK